MISRQTTYEPETDGTVVVAVVHLVAEATEADPSELPPIVDSIDPEALNGLYSGDKQTEYPRLTFTYAGHLVTIDCTRRIRTQEIL